MKKVFVGMLLVCLFSGFVLAADTAAPPKYIWTQHVTVAGDRSAMYPNLIAQFRRAVENTKSDIFWIAASNITGEMRQVNFISFYENLASIEKDMGTYEKISAEATKKSPNFWAEMGATELAPRSVIAKYAPELSYHPEKVAAADARWWEVTTIHLKPGHISAFAELIKQEQELLKKGDIDEHFLVYQVVAGLPTSGSAYFIVVPMKSLAEMDVDRSAQAMTIFTPIIRRHFETVVEKMVSHIDTDLLMVRPEMSRPPQTFLAANPDFWTVKEPAPDLAKSKKAKKAAAEAGK